MRLQFRLDTDRRLRIFISLLILALCAWGNMYAGASDVDAVQPAELPSAVINHTYLPAVGDQGPYDICVLFNRTYYVLTWLKAKEHGWVHPDPKIDPEHVFSWNFSKFLGDTIGFQTHGCATYADMAAGYNEAGWPTREQWESALRYRIDSWENVDTNDAAALLNLKARLNQGEIGLGSLVAYENFQNYGRLDPNPGVDNDVFYKYAGVNGAGHAVTIIGYDDNKTWYDGDGIQHSGAVLAVNSWGADWGVVLPEVGTRGFIWLAYEFMYDHPMSVQFLNNRPETPIEAMAIIEWEHPVSHQMHMNLRAGRVDDAIWQLNFSLNRYMEPIKTRIALDITEPYRMGLTDYWVRSYALDAVFNDFPLQGSVNYFALELPDCPEPWVCDQTPARTIGSQSTSDLNFTFLSLGLFKDEGSLVEEVGLNGTQQLWGSFAGENEPPLGVIHGDAMDPDTYTFSYLTWLFRSDDERGLRVSPSGLPETRMVLASADLDLDGHLDLVTYARDENRFQAWSYSSFGACFSEMDVSFPAVNVGEGSFAMVDFNGDGRSDLVTYEQSWEEDDPAHFKIWFGQADLTFVDSTIQIPLRQHARRQAMAWADVDGDGWLDVALPVRADYISDWDGSEYWLETIVVFRNVYGSGLAEFARCEQYDEPALNMAWGDANNDGLPDLAISDNNLLYINRGGGSFERHVIAEEFLYSNSKIGWADMNNDGWEDLLLNGIRGTTLDGCASEYWMNNGDETFSISGAILPGFDGGSLTSADVDNDGDLDLIGSGFTEDHPVWGERHRDLRLFRNRTAQSDGYGRVNVPPQAPLNLQAYVDGNQNLMLWWDGATDDRTPVGAMRYHLRMGSFPGWSSLGSGAYSQEEGGNRSYGQSTWVTGLPSTSFYCEVQAVDGSGARSPWSHPIKIVRDAATEPCDANMDGRVDIADVIAVAPRQPAEGEPIAPRGDVNADGVVSILDQRYIANQIVGQPMPERDIVAVETIGPAGGMLKAEGFELWIAPRQFSTYTELTLRRLSAERPEGENSVSPMFRIQGLPSDGLTSFSLRIQADRYFAESPLLCFGMSGWQTSGGFESLGSNYMSPTQVDGDWVTYNVDYGPKSLNKDASTQKGYTFTVVEGWFGLATGKVIAYSSHFQVTFPASHDYVAITQLLDALEAAYDKYKTDFGFTYFDMPKGFIQCEVLDRGPNEYGSFLNLPGRAFDKIEFNQQDIVKDSSIIAVTAWHEYAHYVHSQYFNSLFNTIYWMDEACAAWSESKAQPSIIPSIYNENAAAPMHGLVKGAESNAEKHGYGMASLIKYLESRKGEKASSKFWEHIGAGTMVVPNALVFMLGEGDFQWYTDYLEKHVSSQLFAYDYTDVNRDAPAERTLQVKNMNEDKPETFNGVMPDLSGKLFQTITNKSLLPADAVISHRLAAPEYMDLSLFKHSQPAQISLLGRGLPGNGVIKYDVPVSSWDTDGRDRALALITNREGSFKKNYLGDSDYQLQMAVTWDRKYDFPVKSAQAPGVFGGIPAFSISGSLQAPGVTDFEEYDFGTLPGGNTAGAFMMGMIIGQTPLTLSINYNGSILTDSAWELVSGGDDHIYSREYTCLGVKYYRLTCYFDPMFQSPVHYTATDGIFTVEINPDISFFSSNAEVFYDVRVDFLEDGSVVSSYTLEDQRTNIGGIYFSF